MLVLTPEGLDYHNNGTPEFRLLELVMEGNLQDALKSKLGASFDIAKSNALGKKYVKVDAGQFKRNEAKPIVDEDKESLKNVLHGNVTADEIKQLKKRKLIKEESVTSFKVSKGPNFKTTFAKAVADITSEMLKNGTWKTTDFKSINFESKG